MRASWLGIVVLASCTIKGPAYEMKLPERHSSLTNGMHVILLPDSTTELVEVDVRYDVGSNEDPEGKAGLAHLVEHLMFEGHQAGADQPGFSTVLREHSLFYNAFTEWDQTHYMTLAAKGELENLIALEALRLAGGCASIDATTFEREREVVRNEIRQRSGTAENLLISQILAAAYPAGHPYRRDIGGDDAQLASITLADACKFMVDFYVPARATLIIAGNLDEAAAKTAINLHLGPLEGRTPAPLVTITPPTLRRKTIEVEADVEEASVIAVWALPPRFTPEESAFGFIVGQLTGLTAMFGDIYKFMSDIEPMVLGGARAPVLALKVDLRDPSKVDEAMDFILKGARGAHRGIEDGPTFRQYKVVREGALAQQFESLTARTVAFGDYAQFDAGQTFFSGEVGRVLNMDGDHVRKVIEQVLDPDKVVFVVVRPKKGAGLYQRAAGATRGAESVEEFPVDRAEAAVPIAVPAHPTVIAQARRLELDNGMHVVLLPVEEPMPVVSARLVFAAGAALDPPGMAGVAEMAAAAVRPARADGRGFLGAGDNLGAFGISHRGSADPDFTVFRLRGLSIYQDVMLDELEKMVRLHTYSYGLDEVAAEEARLMKRRSARTRSVVVSHLLAGVYGAKHPYAATVPTPETVQRISRGPATDYAEAHYTAANATLILAGTFDPAAAERMIRDKFGGWSRGRADAPVTAPPEPRSGPVYVGVEGEDSPIVQVRLAYPAPAGRDAAYPARRVLAEMLNRRVAAVREKLGASYGVFAQYQPRRGPGVYVVGGGLDAERAGSALEEIRGAIDGLRRADGFLEDFVRARRHVLEGLLAHATDSSSLAEELMDMAELGLAPDAADKLRQQIGEVSPRDVLKLVNTELRPELEVIVGVGPRKSLEKMFAGAGLKGARYEAPK